MENRKPLKTFINYYGGKWRCAPMYPAPEYDTIIEPFAGGAGYSLRYWWHNVRLYEKYTPLVTMWNYLIHADPAEILSLPVIGEFDRVDDIDAPEGARMLIALSISGGMANIRHTPSTWAKQGGGEFWTTKRRQRIADQVPYIRHWTCTQIEDFRDIPDMPATWFVDPPYNNAAGEHYKHGRRTVKYPALAEWCATRSGTVIVCENAGATWGRPYFDFDNTASVKGCAGTGRTGRSLETWCVLNNGIRQRVAV